VAAAHRSLALLPLQCAKPLGDIGEHREGDKALPGKYSSELGRRRGGDTPVAMFQFQKTVA
jgi:hypothetical protein